MSETPAPERTSSTGLLVLLAVITVVGLGLYFWLAPRTPIVATPVGTELTS